jgi:hypothetical protein
MKVMLIIIILTPLFGLSEEVLTNSVSALFRESGKGDNMVVTAKEKVVYNYNLKMDNKREIKHVVTIVNDGRTVTVKESFSYYKEYGSGWVRETSENIYYFNVDKMNEQLVKLLHGREIILKNNGYKPLPMLPNLDAQQIWERCFPYYYMMYPDHTLELVEKQYGVSARDIRVANELAPDESPEVGTTILIPIPIERNGIIKPSNQQVDPIVTTPVDEVEAQSTQGHP